jgi:hypothetical protein
MLRSLVDWLWGICPDAFRAARDPVDVAMERDDIRAAAAYWRNRVATARIGGTFDNSWETTVRERFTDAELDDFEQQMANQLGRAMVYAPNAALWKEPGLELGLYISGAAGAACVRSKLAYNGYFTRMRILPGIEVAHERAPYLSGSWVPIWSATGSELAVAATPTAVSKSAG